MRQASKEELERLEKKYSLEAKPKTDTERLLQMITVLEGLVDHLIKGGRNV